VEVTAIDKLANLLHRRITTVEKVLKWSSGAHVIKLFTAEVTTFDNKLGCLSLASLSSLV